MDQKEVLKSLNKILEHELAGVVKYTHYAFMVQGPYRLSVVQWLREQAQESLAHAEAVGEHVTSLGEHPTLKISDLLETHKHSTEDILNECLEHEREAIKSYYELLNNVKDVYKFQGTAFFENTRVAETEFTAMITIGKK